MASISYSSLPSSTLPTLAFPVVLLRSSFSSIRTFLNEASHVLSHISGIAVNGLFPISASRNIEQAEDDRCFRYMRNEQYAMLRMPYDIRIPFVGCFYMDVLLPNESLSVDSLIQHLDMNQYEMSTRRLDKYDIIKVRFPKFQVQSSIDLNSMLSSIGLSELFSVNADFSSMSDVPLYINKMMQDVEIEVDEKGTLAQAVTITSLAKLSEDVKEKTTRAEFYANRPFIYFIRDYFGSICFAGVYRGGI